MRKNKSELRWTEDVGGQDEHFEVLRDTGPVLGGAGVSGRGKARAVVISRNALFCQGMFEPYLKSFYIRSTDPTQIKILKVSAGQCARPRIPACLNASWAN